LFEICRQFDGVVLCIFVENHSQRNSREQGSAILSILLYEVQYFSSHTYVFP